MAPRSTSRRTAKTGQATDGQDDMTPDTTPDTTPEVTGPTSPENTGTADDTATPETTGPADVPDDDVLPEDDAETTDGPEDGPEDADAEDEPEPELITLLPLFAVAAGGGRVTEREVACLGLVWTMLTESGMGVTVRDVFNRAYDLDMPEQKSEVIESVMGKLGRVGLVTETQDHRERSTWTFGRTSQVLRALIVPEPQGRTSGSRTSGARACATGTDTVSERVAEPQHDDDVTVWMTLEQRKTDGDYWPNPKGRDTTLALLRAHPGKSFTKKQACKALDTGQSGTIGAALDNHVRQGRVHAEEGPRRYSYLKD